MAISPLWFMPISLTTTSASSGMLSRQRGAPIRLLKLPHDFQVRRSVPTNAAIISFVVVLPAEPVMAINRNL